VLSLGIPAIDRALPWGGLPRGCLHEIVAADSGAAAAGFAAMLLARLAERNGIVGWCRRGPAPYGPGLAALGLDPARLIVIRPRSDTDLFWAMEEGLRSGALAAMLAEAAAAPPVAVRRLQLAAEGCGAVALLLRPAGAALAPTPAVTRWRIGGDRTGDGVVRPCWAVELLRCRHGAWAPGHVSGSAAPAGEGTAWRLEWNDETGGFPVAAELRHRSAAAAAAAIAAT
jgi:protein ImuA